MADAQRSQTRPAQRLAARRFERRVGERPDRPPFDEPAAAARLIPDLVEVIVQVHSEEGLTEARRQCRALAARAGYRETDRAVVTAIVSEHGRNILVHATQGEICLKLVAVNGRTGLRIAAHDSGAGIHDIGRAMRDGYSSAGRPGFGLPGVKRLSDELEITSTPGRGTTVAVLKWRN
jgi:serine/threonine-protein kinase RsbT